MASSFLKRKAEQQAKKADERYGAASYGGSASLRPSAAVPERVTNGGGNGAPVTRASNFLTKKAAERAGAIDQQFGTSAYGGSDWTVLDKEQGFNRWLEDMNDFSRRMSGDFAGREGAYQSKQSMDKYRSEAENNMEVMRGRANIYRSYFENNRDLYGDEAVESVLSALNQGEKYMGDLKGGLDSEYDFWSQFEDEKDYDHYKRGKEYAALSDAADFAEKSRYVSTYQPGTEKFNAWTGTYSNSGFGDINYDYINRNQTARDRQMLADIQSNASLLGLDSSERGEMTDDEIAIFNYIYATESPEAAYEYIDYLTSDLNYRQRAKAEEEWAAYAKEHPVGSSVFSVVESPLKGLSYLGQFADYTADGEIDQNEGYNKFSYINSAIRSQVNDIVEQNWGGVGSFAYQTGMSMGDFLFNTAITGGNSALTLGIMGTGAAADTTIAAKDRGLSDDQAFALGTIAGAAEIVTEKVSLDALLDTTSLGKNAMGYLLKNTLAEGSEEVGSDLINLVADVLIAKDKSEWQQSIAAYQEAGMDEKSAFRRALLDQVEMMGLDFLGGAISGGAMSGAGIGINAGLNEYSAQQTGKDFAAMGDDVVLATIQEGLASDPSTRSYQLAQQLQQKLDAGETVTNAELGRLYQANVRAIDAEENSDDLLLWAADEVARKGGVTNSTATDILGNPSAVRTLAQDAGLSLADDMSKAQRRKAVKAAVETLASRSTATTESSAETDMEQTAPSPAAPQSAPVQRRPMAVQAYDIRRVQSAAASLGERGAKALRATYDGSMSADTFYAGFASYYEAGVSGMDMGKVRSEYGAQLSAAQKYAAYVAGQNDAAASLAAEKAAVPSATVYGDDAGFIVDNHADTLSKATVTYYNNLARAVGVKIQMSAATGAGGANGWYANGIIHIAEDAENPGAVVAKHEITHRMQELAPAEYRKYRDYAVNARAERDGSSASLIEQYKGRYADSGVNLTTEQAMDEIAADFTEALTEDPEQFRKLARENKTVAQKLLNAIRDFIAKVKSLFKGKTAQNQASADAFGVDLSTLEEAARLWGEALEAASVQAHALTEQEQRVEFSDVNTRYSLREKDPPKKTGVAYKVFYAKNGQLYPPMVANPGGAGTPVGVWLDADVGLAAPPSKTGRAQVQAGGKGTNAAKGSLAFRPGWHLGDVPQAKQFARKNPETDVKDLFPADFVWAECEYAMDVDYQEEAMSYGYTANGKFRHSYAGLPKLPTDGYYRYRTNPNPDTVPWVITGAMRVKRILTDAETDAICRENGVEPMARQGGPLDEAGLERLGLEAGDVTGETRFSMKSPVEETKNLIALHNLTEEKLWGDLRLGGFPMPSIAVTRIDVPHTNFGDITLVMDKRSIDPKANRKNTVYSADAWTPTFPQVEYAADPAAERRISGRLRELSGKVDEMFKRDLYRITYDMEDLLNRYGGEEGLLRQVVDNYGLKAAYLEDAGHHVSAATVQREADKGYSQDRVEKYLAIVETLGTDDPDEIGHIPLKELRDRYGDELETAFPGMTKSTFRLSGIIRQVQAYLQDQGGEPVYETATDAAATRRAIDDVLDRDGYERWVRELYSGVQADSGIYNNKERFTPAGNRRTFQQTHYPVTLENIVKAMKGQNGGNTKNVSGFYGVKSLRAGTAKRFKSIADMHKLEGRLQNLTEEQTKAIHDELDRRLMDITEALAEKSPNGKGSFDYYLADSIGNMLVEIADREVYTIDAIMGKFNGEYGFHIGNELAAQVRDLLFDVSQMPVNIFEAKPERAVGFDEVLAAVLPDDASGELRDALSGRGVNVLTYKAGDDADRIAKVNGVEGARFSLKEDSEGRKLTKAQREYFRDSKLVDTEGRLLVLYHGTTAYGEITKFRRGKYGWLGPGIYLASRRADAQKYADAMGEGNGQLYELYANVTHPLVVTESNPVPEILLAAYGRESIYKARSAKQGNDTRIITPADIKKLQAKGYDGIRWDFGLSTEVSVFSTEQLKRLDNTNPTEAPDIRYSLKGGGDIQRENAALQEENRLLREQMKDYIDLQRRNGKLRESRDYWQGQTRRTKRVTTDKKAVAQEARELIRSYGADLDSGDITQDLQNLYDYLASGYDGKDELTYTEARRRAEAIAEKLVGNAVAVDETYEQYSDLRAYLRSTTLSLSEEDSRDIPDYGDWRKHQMGRMVIRKGHTNIDQVYQEMSELWPEFFDEQRENNPVDQLLRIAEVMDGIYNVEEYNPFGPYMQQAITGAANEIMERFFDLPQTRATFADRQARKLDDTKAKGRERVQKVREQNAARLAELRQQNRERTTKAVERERTRRAEQIGKLKQRYREKDAAGRERRSARELRAKIMRHASALSQKLLRPSDKQHIPESLRQAVAVMLESINLESAYTTDPNTGKRVKDGSGTPTKRTEAFRALRLAYAEITKDGGDYTLIIDPDLMDNLNELESMKNTPIAEMGTDQLSTVWATLKAVEASIRTANKMLGTSRFETISGFADGIRSDNILRQDRGDYRGVAGKVDRLVNLDMLTPQGYFHRLGKTGEELFRMMRAAQDRHITIMQQAQEKTAEIVGRADVNKLEREKHTFELSGGKVTMSTAQIMGLYELMKRKQAQDHILKGGIRPDTISSGRGLREDRPSAPVKVSVDDLATITGTLTEEQIRIADGLQKFMGGKLAELGNEASMTVYGYRKFTEKDYYPIKVDKNQTKRDISKEAQAATIAGRGFTKSVTPKANNAVMVESIFDTYSSHVNDMATYAAWLPTMENIRRIRDFTFRDGEGNRTGDVKSIIERVFGKNGNAYLNKLVDDINQGVRPNGTGNFTDALVGNYKAAAVAANIRVILQQPTAILRAMSSLDPKYLLAGTVKRGDWAKVKKYAPIAVWKDWGYFDINTGRQMKDVLLSSDSLMEKVKQAAMAGAGKADSFAWARLWNAAEAETRDKRPGLKPGTEAFYQAVGARFSEIVDQTQVVDGLLQRSQIMRSPDALTKMATSFMAEPTKTYNMFVNAVYDLRHATGKDGRSNAKRALARTSAALVVSFAVNAVMQSIVDALRDDDKERDYWEKFLTAYTGFTGEEETALDYWNSFWDGNLEANFNPAGYIPYFKDLVSIMQGYDVSRMDMEPVSKVLEAAANMKKALSGEGKYSMAGASANLLAEVSRLLGIPVANLKRDVQAGITTAAIETDNYLMQYRIDKALLNMGYQGNTKNFYDILYNASINDREAYETIYADMVASGMPEDKIRNAMESRMKRDQGVESVGDLEQRYLSPSQERHYNSTRNSMAGSSVWTAASRDQQEAAEKDLYDLTVGNDSGEKLQEKIAAGAAYGISEADYLLYRLALHVADQPTENGNLGSYTGEEVQTAIDMLPGLDDEARAYLWEAAGKSEKSNPYK